MTEFPRVLLLETPPIPHVTMRFCTFLLLLTVAGCLVLSLQAAASGGFSCDPPTRFSRLAGCPSEQPVSMTSLMTSPNQLLSVCTLLCRQRSWCVAAGVAADSQCELISAHTVFFAWRSSCSYGGNAGVLASADRLQAFHDEFLASHNVTQKKLYLPHTSVRVLIAWLQVSFESNTFISCVYRCSIHSAGCRGVIFIGVRCWLVTDFPLCRWFQQPPPPGSQLTLDDFHSIGTGQCYETVTLRVSDAVDFNRLWADYKAGFGSYHGDYFAGMQWLHTKTSGLSDSRLRVDLLYWSESYIYAKYRDFKLLDETSGYAISYTPLESDSTAAAHCLAHNGSPFMTRDRGTSDCGGSLNNKCANLLPHWHACCHCAGPFGRFYHYPEALNLSKRATGISWAQNAPTNISDGWYYSFKQLEMLLLLPMPLN